MYPLGMPQKTKGYHHQDLDFSRSCDEEIFGVWWEQGLGKSKLLIDTVCHLYEQGKIDGLLVVAPNGVHANMLKQEWPVHAWDLIRPQAKGHIYYSARARTRQHRQSVEQLIDHRGFSILVMSYPAISRTKEGYETAEQFLAKKRCLMVLDESTAIADPKSQTSKKIEELGRLAEYRRVMSGTPVADGPFKIYNQIKFLKPSYWNKFGLSSYVVFRRCFAIYEKRRAQQGHQYEHLLAYRNLDKLNELIQPISSRVLKEDALDLPPKVYSKVIFELSDHQRMLYDQLVEEFRVALDLDRALQVDSAMTRLMRLQQITSGHLVVEKKPPLAIGDMVVTLDHVFQSLTGEIVAIHEDGDVTIDGVDSLGMPASVRKTTGEYVRMVKGDREIVDLFADSTNPRLQALEAILEPITHKVIIWARFTLDIDAVCGILKDACVRYDGQVGDRDRETALDRFRNDPEVRYFVANPEALSMGVTLTQAKTIVYYSNSFKLEKRLQSEDRAHRIGQDVSVNIIDLVAEDTVDEHIVETLREKYDLSATVMGDRLREWIS